MSFRKLRPTSVYLPPEVRSRAELIARKERRTLSPQIVRWVELAVEKEEQEQEARKGKPLCHDS